MGEWGESRSEVGLDPACVDFYLTPFACEPVAVAAPGPVFGAVDEATRDWVAVDVAELLGELRVGDDVEVVVAGLPEVGAVGFEEFGGFPFEDVQGACEGAGYRFA